jgi:pimeloyl-ACP methyl ester carboxylesterase
MPYADVNGLHLYYEEHGEGPPLVLLHGGLMTIELNFGVALPVLAVLPGTTHMDLTRSTLLAPVIEAFLA